MEMIFARLKLQDTKCKHRSYYSPSALKGEIDKYQKNRLSEESKYEFSMVKNFKKNCKYIHTKFFKINLNIKKKDALPIRKLLY